VRELERQVQNKSNQEDKLKKENESYRRQILFYQEKLKLELTNRKLPKNTSPKKKVRFHDTQTHTSSKTILDLSCNTPEKTVKSAYKIARKEKIIKSAFHIPQEVIETPLVVKLYLYSQIEVKLQSHTSVLIMS
jgi:hypothetical protein